MYQKKYFTQKLYIFFRKRKNKGRNNDDDDEGGEMDTGEDDQDLSNICSNEYG